LNKRGNIKIIVYADDILIAHKSIKSTDIIKICQSEFKSVGLDVNESKSKSTEDGGTITFMGQQFTA